VHLQFEKTTTQHKKRYVRLRKKKNLVSASGIDTGYECSGGVAVGKRNFVKLFFDSMRIIARIQEWS
jgi:hypothetical protein